MRRRFVRSGLIWLAVMMGGMAAFGQSPPASPAVRATPARMLAFRLRMNSIEPSQLSVPAGRYLIRIINGILPATDVGYELKRAPGKADPKGVAVGILAGYPSAASKIGRKGSPKARMLVALEPGDYILWAGGRQEWQAQITVTKP